MTLIHVINEATPGGFMSGTGTVGTGEQPLDASEWPIRKWLVIQAVAGNGDIITVGRPGAASSGWVLAAGESTPRIPIDNTKFIAVIGGAAGQQYRWFGV